MSKDETSINPRATLYFPRADILREFNNRRQEPKNSDIPSFDFFNSPINYTNTERCLTKKMILLNLRYRISLCTELLSLSNTVII